MSITYFKPRDRFDFSKDTLDIGNPITWSRSHFLKHFFKRLFAIKEDCLESFYQHHLSYYFANHPDGTEEIFFKNIWSLIERQLKVLMSRDVYAQNHVQNEQRIRKLQKFMEILMLHDRWNHHKTLEVLLAEKEEQIQDLKIRISLLEAKLNELNQYESSEKISIVEGKLATAIDLFRQLQELSLTSGKKLFSSQTQSPWYKLLAKFFLHGDKEIPVNTARNYFPAKKNVKLIKGSEVSEEDKIFVITKK